MAYRGVGQGAGSHSFAVLNVHVERWCDFGFCMFTIHKHVSSSCGQIMFFTPAAVFGKCQARGRSSGIQAAKKKICVVIIHVGKHCTPDAGLVMAQAQNISSH